MHSIIIIVMQKYIETPRLILRDWREEDIPFFARMNADPNVMEFFLNSLSSEESFAFYQRIGDRVMLLKLQMHVWSIRAIKQI